MRQRSPGRAMIIGIALGLVTIAGIGCKPDAVVTVPAAPPAPVIALDTKIAWILRLEQARALRDAEVVRTASDPAVARAARFKPAAAADLEALALDPTAPVRQRAVLAIGRVGSLDGLPAVVDALGDPSADVRASAAFAIGLLGSTAKGGIAPLEAALKDESLVVRARAVDALGLIGDASAAPRIVDVATGCGALIASIAPDDEDWPMAPEIEVCRSALFALVRFGQYEPLAAVALDAQGDAVSRWWPVAFALQRINDRRAVPALRALATSSGIYTAGFALRGLADLKESSAVPMATAIALGRDTDVKLRVAAVRLLGRVGGPSVSPSLLELLTEASTPPDLTIEVIAALGASADPTTFPALADLVSARTPAVRAAAISAAAKVDPDAFLVLLSGIDRDSDWTVRAALATVLGTFPAERTAAAIDAFLDDEDARVHGPALEALAAVKAPDLTTRLFASLAAPDFVERETAARLLGEAKPDGGVPRLVAAYARGQSDATYVARGAALEGLAKYGTDEAKATLTAALADRDWPVRWRAAELLHGLGDANASPLRPAPLRNPVEFFSSPAVLRPAYLPHAFIETDRGTIEVELNVTDATIAVQTFIEQARGGFFNGLKVHRLVPAFVIQAGDPRGDGEGGPGYTIPDELSPIPYLRGTMGMALDWRDTGGSQWFITLSPQPHLDGRYTVFGRVVNGWEVLDRVEMWDVIQRVRIWDGFTFQ